MVSFLVTNTNALIITKSEPVMQHSKNAHLFKFYIPQYYDFEHLWNVKAATVTLNMITPNGKHTTKILDAEDESAKPDHVLYLFELESIYTTASGDIQLSISITYNSPDTGKQVVRTISECTVSITPIEAWTQTISDDSLSDLQNTISDLNKVATAILSAGGEGSGTSTAVDLEVSNGNDGKSNLHLINALGNKIGDGISVSDDSIDQLDGLDNAELDLSKILGGTP